jgi:hypothetical protein
MNRMLLLLAPMTLLAGCAASPTPRYDALFGDAVRQSRQAQVLNPRPSTDPVLGMDGKAAKQATERYQDLFKAPPPVVNVINIGGAIGAPGGGGR